MDFPNIPVTLNGRLYDAIINLNHNGMIRDPATRDVVKTDSLQPDYRAQHAMDKLFKQQLSHFPKPTRGLSVPAN